MSERGRRSSALTAVTALVCLLLLPGLAGAQGSSIGTVTDTTGGVNWPGFRGLHAGAVADDPALPETWSSTEHILWSVDVPGLAWSSPIVWGDHIFVTSVLSSEKLPTPGLVEVREGKTHLYRGPAQQAAPPAEEYRWMLYAFDFSTGRMLWACELHTGAPPRTKHPMNSYASETPVTDGRRVYVYSGAVGLFAVDFDGTVVWSREVKSPAIPPGTRTATSAAISEAADRQAAPGDTLAQGVLAGLGGGASPALYDNRLFVVADHEPRQWFMAAFDIRDGRKLWRVHHLKKVEAYGWSTPFVWKNELRPEVVTAGDGRVRSFDLHGNLLWQLDGLSFNTVPTPFAAHGLLYVASGHPGDPHRPICAIRPGGSGDISLATGEVSGQYVAWCQPQISSHLPSPLVYGDYLYTLHTRGLLTAHDARTGRQVYGRQRIARGSGFFTASPWAYNGKIFALSEDGDTYMIQAGPQYRLLGKNSLSEMTFATPAVARGSVIVRTSSSLYRIGTLR